MKEIEELIKEGNNFIYSSNVLSSIEFNTWKNKCSTFFDMKDIKFYPSVAFGGMDKSFYESSFNSGINQVIAKLKTINYNKPTTSANPELIKSEIFTKFLNLWKKEALYLLIISLMSIFIIYFICVLYFPKFILLFSDIMKILFGLVYNLFFIKLFYDRHFDPSKINAMKQSLKIS